MPKRKQHEDRRGQKQIDVRYLATDEVGAPAAESDKRLPEVFIDTGFLPTLKSTSNARSILVGRTGIGKTALLLEIERTAERAQRVDPLGIAINYIQGTEIPALLNAGVNFDPFFRFLWRHVIALEVLRTWYADRTETKFSEFRLFLERKFGGRQIKQVLDHFERWCGPEWYEPTARTKEIIQKLSTEIKAKIGIPSVVELSVSAKADRERKQGMEQKPSYTREQISNAQVLLQEVGNERASTILKFLEGQVLTDIQKPHYVIIDHLDTAWIDSAFAYDLIEALIDVVGEFAEVPNLKVIVALRQDIITAVRKRRKQNRQQWEKHEGLFLRMRWTDEQLVELIDRRLRITLARYSGEKRLATLLPSTAKRNRTPTEYLLERTLQRPRDLIDNVNRCMAAAAHRGRHSIGWDQIEEAELPYSKGRLEALENEWRSTYPGLDVIFEAFRGMKGGFTVRALTADAQRLAKVLEEGERHSNETRGGPKSLPQQLYERLGDDYSTMWTLVATVLYEIGFLGVKPSPSEPFGYVYNVAQELEAPIDGETPLMVHPMFCRALGIDTSSLPSRQQ